MRRIFTSTGPTIIALITGWLVLISFAVPLILPPQHDLVKALINLRKIMVDIAVSVAGMALLLGFFRLLNFHRRRVQQRKSGYSLVALIFAVAVFIILSVEQVLKLSGNQAAANLPVTSLIFNSIIAPIQSSLGALLAIFLGAAAVRMAQRRRSWGTLWFLLSAIIVLLTQIPVSPNSALLPFRQILDALATGGLRGLLLGVALGTLAVAFRVLLAIDQPQGE